MDFDTILNSPFVSELKTFLASTGLLSIDLLSYWTLIQIGLLLFSILVARFLVGILKEPISNRLRNIEGQRGFLKFLVILHRNLFWFLISLQLWIGYGILRMVTWPSHSYITRVAAGLTATWFVISVLTRLIKNRFLSKLVAPVAWTISALYILGVLPRAIEFLDYASFDIGTANISLLSVIKTIFMLGLLIWLALSASNMINSALEKNDDISPSIKVLLHKIIRFALLALAILVSLSVVGIDFTALAVFSGAVGIGIGLGLQKIVSNFLSGIILLLDKSIKPGDVIEIDTVSGGTYGWVQHLGARYTAVRTRDGTETLIPNETFIDSAVTNWTHTNKIVRRKLPIGVSYDTDVEKAIELCIEAANATQRVLKVPQTVCLIKGFGDSSVDLELRFWINDPDGGVANVSSKVYLEVWKRFQEHNIEIPFPQRDLNIRSSVPIEVKTKK